MNTPPVILELTVNNHPGVMSHITNLFARRAFNLEGILCGPLGDGNQSRIYLLVAHDARLEQITKQLTKLHDVCAVTLRPNGNYTLFYRLEELIIARG
jgi:acetolactate synthase-1/3 small subunit